MRLILFLGIALLNGLVFQGVRNSQFVLLDDDMHITQNPHLGPRSRGIGEIWAEPYQGLYIPVTYTAWAAQKAVFEKYWDIWGPGQDRREAEGRFYHSVNLGFHVVNACLVVLLLDLLIGVPWISVLGALIFSFHPVQVEAVAWISGLKDLLSGFFSLIALLAYLSANQRSREGRARPMLYLAAALSFALATLSKPSAVALPLIALWLDWGLGAKFPSAALKAVLALAAAAPLAWITKLAQPSANLSFVAPWYTRPLIASDALTFYFSKVLTPLQLAPDYGRHPSLFLKSAWPWLTWTVPTLLLFVLLRRRRSTQVSFAVFLSALLPVLGFVPFYFQEFSTVADRYLYLAMLGPIYLVGQFLRTERRAWAPALAVGLTGVLAVLAYRQAGIWKDSVSLFSRTIEVNPDSILAHNNIGTLLEEKGDTIGAAFHYQEVLRIEPGNLAGHYNFARLLAKLGHTSWSKTEFLKVLAKEINIPDAHYSMGILESRLGNYETAKGHLFLSLRARPNHSPTLTQLGTIYREAGDCDRAMRYFEVALTIEPESPDSLYGKGKCLQKFGKRKEAIPYFEKAAQVLPDWETPRAELARLRTPARSG